MLKYNHTKKFASAARLGVAFSALAALGGGAAHAQVTLVSSPNQLTNPVQTSPFPATTGNNTPGQVASTFTVSAGSNSVSFTSALNVGGVGFESAIANANDGPQFTPGDELENTFVAVTNPNGSTTNQITGPLTISFLSPVTGFGLYAQDYNSDTETFTLNLFNGATQIGTVSSIAQDNFSTARGNAVFIGALASVGGTITSATLSSLSVGVGGGNGGNVNNGNNDFFFGPVQVQGPKPVPEASTFVSLGMGLLLFGSLALRARKRDGGQVPEAA